MKAEHRKELETNVLADRMGRFISGARQGPSRSLIYWVLGALALLVAVFILYRWRIVRSEQAGLQWVLIEDGSPQYLDKLAKEAATQNSGRAAQFQMAWENLWVKGIKSLGAPKGFEVAMGNINEAEQAYRALAKTCKDDPVFYPEALYALAVITETRAVEDRDNLAKALEAYKEVQKAGKDSAFYHHAQQLIEALEDPDKSTELKRFYQDLQLYLKSLPPSGPACRAARSTAAATTRRA